MGVVEVEQTLQVQVGQQGRLEMPPAKCIGAGEYVMPPLTGGEGEVEGGGGQE